MANYMTPGMGTYGSTWQHGGYSGSGNVAELLGSATGRPAIVCGSAEGVFDELAAVKGKLSDPLIFAANDIGMFLGHLDHWVSLHGKFLANWKRVRWQSPRKGDGNQRTWIHSMDAAPEVDYVWDGLNPHFALSGYFAMQVAWLMGCQPIVMCGCPGSVSRRFFDERARDFGYGGGNQQADKNIQTQVKVEMSRVPELKAVVRSMSGWTQTYFGGL